uniref:Major facilitator superfamily (MFS) profile domain-containing protein n=1 Tax=Bionectria ochroleuca TaxID=29856 RepID=A0A8H7K111_BIOOC
MGDFRSEKPSEGDAQSDEVAGATASVPFQDVQCPPHTTERRLLVKIDLHVVPFLCIMYLLAFLDRVNISNANVFGLSTELGLKKTEFNAALVIFFVPYVLFEIPSNLLLKKLRPNVWLSINMFGFGLVTLLQGLVTNYSGLLAARFFLGVFETGMFPGAFYLIGMWYKRNEAQRRYSFFFFNSTTLAGAFGGLLAAAIGKMDGLRGYKGWRWIFIIKGGVTVVWLSPEEKEYVTTRLRIDQGQSSSGRDRKVTWKDVGNVFKDYKIILGGFMYFGLIVPALRVLCPWHHPGLRLQPHPDAAAQCAPWAVAFVFSMAIAVCSDKLRHRFGFAVSAICVAIAGFAILISVHDKTSVQYVGLFLVASGAYTAMPIIVCWFNMNLGGHHRRSIGSAWQIGFGNIGGIIASFSFTDAAKPRYIPGYSICIAFTILSMLSVVAYAAACVLQNRRKSRAAGAGGLTEEKEDLGDMAPGYRYLL